MGVGDTDRHGGAVSTTTSLMITGTGAKSGGLPGGPNVTVTEFQEIQNIEAEKIHNALSTKAKRLRNLLILNANLTMDILRNFMSYRVDSFILQAFLEIERARDR